MIYYYKPSHSEIIDLIKRPAFDMVQMEQKIDSILENVRKNGDQALREYALEFDNVLINEFEISSSELKNSEKLLSQDLKDAIDLAYSNIEKFHKVQIHQEPEVETLKGVVCWRKNVPIESVGIYIPGGTAPLFSTVLMLGIPAKIAGCKQIVLCSPSNHPAIYYCAQKIGISKVYRIGGAQAIGAMAYGTESIPKVNKIFGPGNQFVTTAKQLLSKSGIAIDMPAGPSEVAVFADKTGKPSFIASDLLSQAEHGKDSQVLFITTDEKLINSVRTEIESQLELLPRKEFIEQSLKNSKLVFVEKESDAIAILNDYAPEHLIIAMDEPDNFANKIINAGSVFLGHYSPESAGDYASGTNHTLPTNGHAKAYSGVSTDSFLKKITFQKISRDGLSNLGPSIEVLANAEDLMAHKNAVTIRLKSV